MRRALVTLVLPLLLLVGCRGDEGPDESASATASATGTGTATGDAADQPCGPPPTPLAAFEGKGALLPPGAIVTKSSTEGPLTTHEGFVPDIPVNIRAWYEEQSGGEVLRSEDEGHEAELLVTKDGYRTDVKVNITCAKGSRLRAIVAAETAGTTETSG